MEDKTYHNMVIMVSVTGIILIITSYIVWDIFNTLTNQPKINWVEITDVGGPLPITPALILTIIDIVLSAFLIKYLCSPEVEE